MLAQELSKHVIKILKGRRVCPRFNNKIWSADLAEMGSRSSKNGGVKCLLCVIDVFTGYGWIKPFKDKEAKTVLNGFDGIVNESKRKPNKLLVYWEKEYYK